MGEPLQQWYIRPEGESFDIDVYDTYSNLFSIKLHYGGRFMDSPNKQYVNGEICFVDKIMDLYVELVEKTESSSDEDGQSDNESEDANDFVDEEHLVDEVKVNMSSFNFKLDGEYETKFIDPIKPHVNVTGDDLEVLDFDSLKSDQDDVGL
ncbi:hypothetical protein Tco_0368884 [Tanacetum coccineum]